MVADSKYVIQGYFFILVFFSKYSVITYNINVFLLIYWTGRFINIYIFLTYIVNYSEITFSLIIFCNSRKFLVFICASIFKSQKLQRSSLKISPPKLPQKQFYFCQITLVFTMMQVSEKVFLCISSLHLTTNISRIEVKIFYNFSVKSQTFLQMSE